MERGATLATAQEVLFGGLFFKMFPLISFHRDILVYGLQQPQHTLKSRVPRGQKVRPTRETLRETF